MDKIKGIIAVHPEYAETLRGYAENNMNAIKTAKALCCHRHTIEQRLMRIKEYTGIDPTSFRGLCQLLQYVEVTE